jgi:hypothetical protein
MHSIEVGLDCEVKLLEEEALVPVERVLLVQQQYRLFVAYFINTAIRKRGKVVRQQYCVADESGRALVAIRKGLEVGYQCRGDESCLFVSMHRDNRSILRRLRQDV